MGKVIRKGKFDAGHRVMHERFKCFNVHGHEYHYELHFEYRDAQELGYAIDFKEIKRVACQWIDDVFDHGFIANPKDHIMVKACRALSSKLYVMNLVDAKGFANPSAENIAKEIFFGVSTMMNCDNLWLSRLVLHETINCFVECDGLTRADIAHLRKSPLRTMAAEYKKQKGIVEYDDRKSSANK